MTHTEEMQARLLAFALSLPEAWEDHPWGETVVKVRKKVFVFLGTEDPSNVGFGVKLPESREEALAMDGIDPMGYGLGKSGWVAVSLPEEKATEPELYLEWIMESYRAVAPKKLAAALDARFDDV